MKSALNREIISAVAAQWKNLKSDIETRLGEFAGVWSEGSEKEIFSELVFCLFTPQSKAKSCWAAVESLSAKGLLTAGSREKVYRELACVRFNKNKSGYVMEARKLFCPDGSIKIRKILSGIGDEEAVREWLVKNVKGIGYKEASHFLRNIGFSQNLAILDRHILKNLKLMGVIKDIPGSITKKEYFKIENKMRAFTRSLGIPLNHLDLVLWHKEAGELFK